MRGEGDIKPGKRTANANAEPANGGGGGVLPPEDATIGKVGRTARGGLAIGTQDWVAEKIAAGELTGGEHALAAGTSGTSIFDPVLCELCYRWFCPPNGVVLDPFAGGSVRGVVAGMLGRRYVGVDLRPEQIAANDIQVNFICTNGALKPVWIQGDAADIDEHCAGLSADFVFSCPPYADLERYSDDPRDLSTMDYADFRQALDNIVAKSCALLKPDRFACFVVGDARGPDGNYYGLPGHTIEAFNRAGLALYNNAILVTAAGSLPIRVRRQFEVSRKLGTTHQHVLIFIKGDARKATEAVGPVEFGELAFADSAGQDAAAIGGEIE
jgi:hypothetical protein